MNTFLLQEAVLEVLTKLKLENQSLVLLNKTNSLAEVVVLGQASLFRKLLYRLIKKSVQAYHKECINKIVLISAQLVKQQQISVFITGACKVKRPLALREGKSSLNNKSIKLLLPSNQ